MFALEMTLLTGRYVATAYSDRSAAEWPPHPARLFSAMVAAHHAEPCPEPAERAALEWLAQQGAPAIRASEAAAREVVTVFVPVNDPTVVGSFDVQQKRVELARVARDGVLAQREEGADRSAFEQRVTKAEAELVKAKKSLREQFAKSVAMKDKVSEGDIRLAESVLPEGRGRQPRTFPSVTPNEPFVYFQWPTAEPPEAVRDALQRICERVVRVGHSSSLVGLRVCDDVPPVNWEPDEASAKRLRVPLQGQLDRLEREFGLHQETQPRVLPAYAQGYGRHRDSAKQRWPCSVFEDDWLVLRLSSLKRDQGGQREALPILSCAMVAEGVRAALQSYCEEPVPEVLSGHASDGSPSQRAHLAVIPLPWVAGMHADGHLLGVALVMPREVPREERLAVFRAVAAWEDQSRGTDSEEECPELRLNLGRAGAWGLRRLEDVARLVSLRSATWCGGGQGERVWMSATPVALDRNPGDLRSRDAEKSSKAFADAAESIQCACGRIGLPRPEHVWITRSAPLAGSEKARRFPRFPAAEAKAQRVLVHATLCFAQPVIGPVLLGAGRYRGLGLFRPMSVDLLTREEAGT